MRTSASWPKLPGTDLWHDSFRSGIGRFSKRPDLAALIVVLAFGAFVNAAGMIAPVLEWQDRLPSLLGQRSPLLGHRVLLRLGLVVLPALLIGTATAIGRLSARSRCPGTEIAARFSYALVPLGFSMWLAHYSFHFLTSYDAIFPVVQRFAGDLGWAVLGEPAWACACCRPVADWLPRLEILFLDMGFLLSLYSGYRIAQLQTQRELQALKLLAPWALLIVVLFALGVWIVLQPMQMRGMLPAGG